MGQPTNTTALVYFLLVVAFMALVLISNNTSKPHSRFHRRSLPGRRLKVRATTLDEGNRNEHVAFDPVVGTFERRREDRAWEKHHFEQQYKKWGEEAAQHNTVEDHHQGHHQAVHAEAQPEPEDFNPDYADPEEFLNNEEQFNITLRLTILFPLLDINPRDDFVSLSELQNWHLVQSRKQLQHRTERTMSVHDENHDGLITFKEYLPHLSDEEIGMDSQGHGDAAWYREQFEICDANKDGFLNATEFKDFLYTDDSDNPLVQKWCRAEQIRSHDKNHDKKLDWEEFHHGGMFDRLYEPTQGVHDHLLPASEVEAKKEKQSKEQFSVADTNKDGFLIEDELAPLMERLSMGELFYAKQQSQYLLMEADDNKDGRLSLDEMLNHPYVFYSTAYDHQDEYDYSHDDEFR